MVVRGRSSRGARGQRRREKPVVLIVCEGETERRYFADIKRRFRANWVEVYKPHCNDPRGIVAAARRRWRELVRKGLYVEPWVVFDAESREDEGPRGYSEAIALAEKAGISAANSSPSFEYWILLHYVPGVLVDSPSDAERELGRDGRILGYEKPGLPYEDLWTRYLSGVPSKAARARRSALADDGVNERMGRPVTYVDGLVDRLAEIAGDRG